MNLTKFRRKISQIYGFPGFSVSVGIFYVYLEAK